MNELDEQIYQRLLAVWKQQPTKEIVLWLDRWEAAHPGKSWMNVPGKEILRWWYNETHSNVEEDGMVDESYYLAEASDVSHNNALGLHPLLAGMRVGWQIAPAELGTLIFTEIDRDWKIEAHSQDFFGPDGSKRPYRRLTVVRGGHVSPEEPEDRQLRFLTSGLLNLTNWADLHLIEHDPAGTLMLIPVGFRDEQGRYALPNHQNGFPFHRVLYLPGPEGSKLVCTCALTGALDRWTLTDLSTHYHNPQARNRLVCAHKEILRLLLAKGLINDYGKENITQWTTLVKSVPWQ